jgi:acetoin utilization deacetylase AcuC-like enzyme
VTIGFITHPIALSHEMPPAHPERAERIAAIRQHLEATGLLDDVAIHQPEPAARESIELVHESRYIDLLEELDAAGGGRIDADTSMGPHSLEAALRGTQGAVDAVRLVLDGEWTGAFSCMRPPGHHATPQRGMGFCLFDHVAVAARAAIASGEIDRALILDWDAHHGNGTQDAFWTDPSVLYVSLHQYPWYPGTGDVTERGEGDGYGTTLNVPLPAGAAEDAYDRALDEIIEPVVASFDPQLVLVSAGYDAHHRDPLCMMRLTAGAFFRLTRRVAAWGKGPVCVLEGGYDLDALAWSAAATVSAMAGASEPVGVEGSEVHPLTGHPDAMRWVDRAAAVVGAG